VAGREPGLGVDAFRWRGGSSWISTLLPFWVWARELL
jgi:hypothetical protein